jgi:hypothetical protein
VHADEAIIKHQANQHGLVSWRQLLEAGLTVDGIRHRVRKGTLIRLRRGVYAHPVPVESFRRDVLAATLEAGETAFASHTTAARLRESPVPEGEPQLEVSTALERQPRIKGVVMHRSGLLDQGDVYELDGILVASVERTIVDLSGRLDQLALGRLVDDALRRRLTSIARLYGASARLKQAPGRSPKRLAEVLQTRTPGSESHLEDFVLDAITRYGLPAPVRQHPVLVGGRERRIDICYPLVTLALEALGFEYHGMRSRFDEDALRGNELLLAGYRLLEFTSAFDDWTIASQVARALDLPAPRRIEPVIDFATWRAVH